nr:hypothetical protein Iba_chr05cCG6230 [Ipomoea batatas]GMD07561.1 hypothetical protein Iba_scaffold39656CG0010 [Ipomoea batatas]
MACIWWLDGGMGHRRVVDVGVRIHEIRLRRRRRPINGDGISANIFAVREKLVVLGVIAVAFLMENSPFHAYLGAELVDQFFVFLLNLPPDFIGEFQHFILLILGEFCSESLFLEGSGDWGIGVRGGPRKGGAEREEHQGGVVRGGGWGRHKLPAAVHGVATQTSRVVLEAFFVGHHDGVVKGIMALEDAVAAKRQGLSMVEKDCGSLNFSFWRFHSSIAAP